jgi:hypothetical protein
MLICLKHIHLHRQLSCRLTSCQALIISTCLSPDNAEEAIPGAINLSAPGGGSQLLMVQTTQCVLTLLGSIARAARLWLPAAQALRVLSTLNLPALLRTLAVSLVGGPPGSSYGCKVMGVALMQELLMILRGAQLVLAGDKVSKYAGALIAKCVR